MPFELTASQRATLRAVCDTFVPAIERADDPDGFWARAASDVGTDEGLAQFMQTLPADQSTGLAMLLDALAEQGFEHASQLSREQLLRNVALASRDAAGGVAALGGLTLFFTYGGVDEAGQNPNWKTFGYPGPVSLPPQTTKEIAPLVPEEDTTLEADVVVVGSGAGGGVIAGRLAGQGLKVVVLEAGGHFDESDFNQVELWAYQNLYYRGGPTPTADQNISLQAGSCLGGGTVVNWTNSLRTRPWVREQWARDFGLADVATDAFDAHTDAVFERLSVNDACSDLNRGQQRMQRGAEKLGWSFIKTFRNTDPATYDPASAGYIGWGDQSGSKQSTAKTYLVDAVRNGAVVITGCWADRVIVEGGRAAGVEATWSDRAGTAPARKVTVRAPQVVVACGALESPALLLRTGIGGPAAGRHLRLHPSTASFGIYDEDMQAWWGAPHAGLVDEFAGDDDGYGFLLEGAQYSTAVGASAIPFTTASEHKAALSEFRHAATFIGLLRDHGAGQVTIDEQGAAVPWYDLTDERDVANTRRAIDAQIRLHAAAGADRVHFLAAGLPTWHRGEDLDAFIARAQRTPLRYGGARLFSAHQMGTCRMGTDPAESVANPQGELHDTPGVWIGDASAFPTSSGTNPMITIMALADRTADHIAAAAGKPVTSEPALT